VFWYAAEAAFNGWDSFTYVVSDGRSSVQRYVGIQVGAAPADPAPSTAPVQMPPPPATPAVPTAPALPKGLKRATGLTLGDVEAYVPSRTARLGRHATQVLVLRTVTDATVEVRPSLRAGGRTIRLDPQRLRVGATRLGTLRLALDARTRRALHRAHSARLTLQLAERPAGAKTLPRDSLTLNVRLP
jgi:hypothetical protein